MRVRGLGKWVMLVKIAAVTLGYSLWVIAVAIRTKPPQGTFLINRMIHAWAGKILAILRVSYQIFGVPGFEFSSSRPYLLMSNHLSHLDIPLIYSAFPEERMGMVAKKELFKIPFFGSGMRAGGCIALDRENRRGAVQDLALAKAKMLDGVRVWIAPEGTRSKSGKLGKFKRGGFKIAMEAQAIIVPVTIVGSDRVLPAGTLDFGIDEQVKVYINSPIDTLHYSAKDIQGLMEDTQRSIASRLSC